MLDDNIAESELAESELVAAWRALEEFDLSRLAAMSDKELCLALGEAEAVSRKLSAIQVAGAAEVAERSHPGFGSDSLSQRHGCVKANAFLEKMLKISGAEADRRIHLGSALRAATSMSGAATESRFPELATAVAAGEVGSEAASVIVRALDATRRTASPEASAIAEAGLVDFARHNPVSQVARLARSIRDRLDPDGVLPREEETNLRRGIQLGRERNGIVPISGGLSPIEAALLKAAFDEANAPGATPRFLSEWDRISGTTTTANDDGTQTVQLRDVRTRQQRQHDVLGGLLRAGIRNTGRENGQLRSLAEVTVHVSLADLEAHTGVGHIDGIEEPVSINTVERILCDANFRKMVLGNDGEVLALGKKRYPFTSAQRKAVIARDGDECLLCDVPGAWADGHHVVEYWTKGALGETDVDNLVLLCGPDHDFIHHSDWKISMINGIPHLLAPPEIDPSQTWQRLGKSRVNLNRSTA